MSSVKSKVHPSLSNKAFVFSESPLSSKLALKTFDDINLLKSHPKSSRSVSPQTINIPKTSSFAKSQENVHSARTYSQDRDFTSNKRSTLPILQTIKVYKESHKQKPTPKSMSKTKSGVTDSSQSNLKRGNRSPDKKSTKLFRIRTSTSSNHLVGFDVLKSSKSKNFVRNHNKKAGSMPVVGDDLDLLSPRSSDIGCMCFNNPSQARMSLPLLIIHFEGIMGSCLIQNRDHNKENSNKENNVLEDYLFIRKDVKDELKHLSKKFLVAIVFPSLNNKYKTAMKFLINRKFCFDGAYYKSQEIETSNKNDISQYLLNYKKIVSDFKAVKSNKKVIILLPLNLSLSIIKDGLISSSELNIDMEREFYYEKSCFNHFFPKIQVLSENLRTVCLPNFLLEEKNESYSALFKSEFSSVSKLVFQIYKDNFTRPEARIVKKETKDSETIDALLTEKQAAADQEQHSKEQIETNEIVQTPRNITDESPTIKGKNFRTLNLDRFFHELDRIQQMNSKLRKIQAIKGPNELKKEITNFTFDQSQMRQKLIEDLAAMQRQRIALKGNSPKENGGVLITGVVGDLFTGNANIIRLYEKDSFYSNKKETKRITELTDYLNTEKGQTSNCNIEKPCRAQAKLSRFPEEFKEPNSFSHSINIERSVSIENQKLDILSSKIRNIDEEEEALSIKLIKRLSSHIYLYLEEQS